MSVIYTGTLVARSNLFNTSLLNDQTGTALASQGQSVGSFFGSLVAGIILGTVQFLAFLYLKERLPSIYIPKTFLVPQRERVDPPPRGPWQWMKPIFQYSDEEFLRKCGLDAFFLCRYLYVLLQILGPLCLVILPILLPINATGGNNVKANVMGTGRNVTKGLDIFTISNIQVKSARRLWAHCLLAVVVIIWSCYIISRELRNYIHIRQSFLTSPQHRLRASASTVLVHGVPRKFLDVEELNRLFDVYPGGIRNVWVNRNYQMLSDLIEVRDKWAKSLESAEAELIKLCWEAHSKKHPEEKTMKKEKKKRDKDTLHGQKDGVFEDLEYEGPLTEEGMSANNPGQVHHTVGGAIANLKHSSMTEDPLEQNGNILGRGLGAVAHGVQKVGQTVRGGVVQIGRGIAGRDTDGPSDEKDGDGSAEGPDSGSTGKKIHDSAAKEPASPDGDELGDEARPSGDNDSTRAEETTATQPNGEESGTEKRKSTADIPRKSGSEEDAEETAKRNLSFDMSYDQERGIQGVWRKYIKESDRPKMRVKSKLTWLPSLINPTATKVDTIWHCRKELSKLNRAVEVYQTPEFESKFPKMNSAFIQFNNQTAAHMACQSIAHQSPNFMTPRLVEISPNDVIWKNMSISWWSKYLRTAFVLITASAAVVFWAVPVAFSSSLSQIDVVRQQWKFLSFLENTPGIVITIIQGVLPPLFIAILVRLLGALLRVLVKIQGASTKMEIELSVQKYFFAFSFVQYFIIVTIASALTTLAGWIQQAVEKDTFKLTDLPEILAQNIPVASNYFLSNIILQSLSESAGGLLQIFTLILGVGLKPLFHNLARSKFNARTKLQIMNWGTTYPLYTTFACIALIYSVISPLILILGIIGFGLWWISTRYQMLYIYRYTVDTGGRLFPQAVKQLFVGIYILELFMIGFLSIFTAGVTTKNSKISNQEDQIQKANTPALVPLIVIMVVALFLTVLFQLLLMNAFNPLLYYLPITLEDAAVERDEEFQRILRSRHSPGEEANLTRDAADEVLSGDDDDNEPSHRNRRSGIRSDVETGGYTPRVFSPVSPTHLDVRLPPSRHVSGLSQLDPQDLNPRPPYRQRVSWADRSRSRSLSSSRRRNSSLGPESLTQSQRNSQLPRPDELPGEVAELTSQQVDSPKSIESPKPMDMQDAPLKPSEATQPQQQQQPDAMEKREIKSRHGGHSNLLDAVAPFAKPLTKPLDLVLTKEKEAEARKTAREREAYQIYGNIPDDLEALTPEERDALVDRAFKHAALRAKRPCIWLPRDRLGVSDDEVKNTAKFTKWIWISNEHQIIDDEGKFQYRGPPPDFDEVDLIQL